MNNEQIEKVLEQLTGIVTTLTTEVSQLKANASNEKKEEEKKEEGPLSHLTDEDLKEIVDEAVDRLEIYRPG